MRDLVRVFNKDAVKNATGDVFGRIYEYFLMKDKIEAFDELIKPTFELRANLVKQNHLLKGGKIHFTSPIDEWDDSSMKLH